LNLSAYGFIPVGEWILSDTVKSHITFKLKTLASDRVVYAFVVEGMPKYIGICEKDTTALKDRMGRYKGQQGSRPNGISTNERISIEIRQMLNQGKRVEIYALKPTNKQLFVDLQVDLVKGLENPLIARFQPAWNH
jgi:hypothetical protein